MFLGRKFRKSQAAKEAAKKNGPPNPKGRPKGAKNILTPEFRKNAVEVMREMGYDPIRRMIQYAEGDVVGLGLMTQAQRDEAGQRVKRNGHLIAEPSGQERALLLISTDLRSSMHKELAKYGYSKKPTSVEVSGNGAQAGAGVMFYLPLNGRDATAPDTEAG